MYEKFLKQTEDFIFIDDKPEKADVIFVPGNGYPQMAEKAAELYRRGLAPRVLPSGRYSVSQLGNLPGFWIERNIIMGIMRRNGIF